jgi:hypothetical protein
VVPAKTLVEELDTIATNARVWLAGDTAPETIAVQPTTA